jgi:hypothetical protein
VALPIDRPLGVPVGVDRGQGFGALGVVAQRTWAALVGQPLPDRPVQRRGGAGSGQRAVVGEVRAGGRQERPIARGEREPVLAELAFQHRDLVAQGEYLNVLAPIAHRQQAQHGEWFVTPR